MDSAVHQALQYDYNLKELKGYFDRSPFTDIIFDNSSKLTVMMDSGYTYNITTKFWRILQSLEDVKVDKSHIQKSSYNLEVFTNRCLGCTDMIATWTNHFLQLGLKGPSLSIHKSNFINKVKESLDTGEFNDELDQWNEWTLKNLYPYRNIIHHMGELSGTVQLNNEHKVIDNLVPSESDWDFEQIRNDLREYPSHTAWKIATNNIDLPNIITGHKGDTHKYTPISEFCEDWKDKVFEIITLFVRLVNNKRNNT